MSTELMPASDLSLVALTPSDVPRTQRQIADWCRAKVIVLGRELREQRENLRQAKRLKWKHSGWVNAVSRTKKRMVYYAKIKAAVEAGYLIVPNFDVDVIAVRVQRRVPPNQKDVKLATPELLPPHAGRYVDDTLIGYTKTEQYTNSRGEKDSREWFVPTEFDESIDFPVGMVKPIIMEATQRAMADRIFDRIGIVRKGRRSDPIIVGQIINPKTRNGWSLRQFPDCATFFIAWWLDTKDL